MNKNVLTFLLLLFVVSLSAEYKLGVDYRIVENPLPVKKDGVVEVSETFWYGCNACYQFNPAVDRWSERQGSDVVFTKIPVTWGQIHQLHASLYYTIEALNLDPSTHSAVFVTIHKEGNFLQSQKAIQSILSKFGVAPEVSAQYLNSFTVKQRVNRSIKHSRQLKVSSVPMMIVDGKYIIESKCSYENILKVVDYVVELQKHNY